MNHRSSEEPPSSLPTSPWVHCYVKSDLGKGVSFIASRSWGSGQMFMRVWRRNLRSGEHWGLCMLPFNPHRHAEIGIHHPPSASADTLHFIPPYTLHTHTYTHTQRIIDWHFSKEAKFPASYWPDRWQITLGKEQHVYYLKPKSHLPSPKSLQVTDLETLSPYPLSIHPEPLLHLP